MSHVGTPKLISEQLGEIHVCPLSSVEKQEKAVMQPSLTVMNAMLPQMLGFILGFPKRERDRVN